MENNNLEKLRHSCAHIMAAAVKHLFPKVKLGIGPAIENGFYYDFFIPSGLKEAELPEIEEEMKKIISLDQPFIQEFWPRQKAEEYFRQQEEDFKLEILKDLAQEEISIYKTGDFIDLCRGPHIESTGQVKFFKLLSISAAYWKADENNPQLIRIYGTAFLTKEELKKYLYNLQEAKRRDHRVLGPKLGLFNIFHETAGAGLVFYLPKGAILRRVIEDWEIKEHQRRGYKLVNTPHIMHKNLWIQSGHHQYYSNFMYSIEKENQEFILKPMNCPGHILIYKSEVRSWRDLPLRLFELGTVYRYEKSGVLHGLLRVRGFTQDDAHIFCRNEDLKSELSQVLDFVEQAMKKFGFKEYSAELSTRPENFIGDIKDWDLAEKILEEILQEKGISYVINSGDGAFYGPKIDIGLKDALGRKWQCATVQLDYSLPKKFEITYRDQEGNRKQVIMIHRVILGSLERFIATLTEHYAGRFPLWLAPIQVGIVPITEEYKDYAQEVNNKLLTKDIRTQVALEQETMQRRIRRLEIEKVPYILVVGGEEKTSCTVSVRKSGEGMIGKMGIDEFINKLKQEVSN